MTPPSKISSCSLGIAFWVTQVGWQFLSTLILSGNICFWAKNYLEKILEYHFWSKGHFSRSMRGTFLKFQRHVRGQNRGFWGWQTQLDHSQVCSMCISRVCTCISRVYTCMHVKYTWYTPGSGLVVFATLKNPYFDPSYISEASEIFLSLILKNDPCLKNGTLKLFLCNFLPRSKCYHLI